MAIPCKIRKLNAVRRLGIWRQLLTALIGVALVAAAVAAEDGFPALSIFDSSNIGHDESTHSSIQDTDGVLLLAASGLVSYDGERWRRTLVPGVPYLKQVRRGRDGRVWSAGLNGIGYFERGEEDRWEYVSLLDQLPRDVSPIGEAWDVFPLRGGAVFLTADRLLRWNGREFHVTNFPGSRRITGFQLGDDVYVHYRRVGLFRVTDDEPVLVLPQSEIHPTETAILAAFPWHDNSVLFATGRGLVLWHRDGSTSSFAPGASRILEEAAVTCGVPLPDGRAAFGTLRSGLVIIDQQGNVDRILGESGLPSVYVRSLFVDRDGDLWVNQPMYVVRISMGSTAVFDHRTGLPKDSYVMARDQGRLRAFSTTTAYQWNESSGQFVPVTSHDVPHCVVPTPWGVALGSYRGAWLLSGDTKTLVHTTDRDVHAIAVSRTRPGTLLVFETNRLVRIDPQQPNQTPELVAEGLPGATVSGAEDRQGRIWIGTFGAGVYLVDPQTQPAAAQRVPAAFALPALRGSAYARCLDDGSVLLAADNGAWVLPPGGERFAPVRGYAANSLSTLGEGDLASECWVLQTNAANRPIVGRIRVQNGEAVYQPHEVPGLNAIGRLYNVRSEKGGPAGTTLWIGGERGMLKHVVPGALSIPPPRTPILRAYAQLTNSDELTLIRSTLPFSTRAIVFEFAAPEFGRRSGLQLETRIDGIDTQWMPARGDSRRELAAVRDGSYTFRVRTMADTGVASEPTVFAFQVAPPWWRTAPAFALGVVLAGSAAYSVYRLRVRSLRRQNVVLEQKVRERTEELAEASAAKTMFVANMSHDIRNPLNGIAGLALALEDTRLDARQKDLVATLRECTSYLSSLVDDVLDFASIEAGRLELRPGPYEPAELLNSVTTTLKAQANERNAFITIETDPDLPATLRGDAGRIQQILVNYVSNALKYAPGHIRLSAGYAPDTRDEVEFSVADEGAGISETDQATLFTKFTRLESARRGQVKGSGLGLASCRLLADLMGGSVGVESRPGHGSRFYLRLPLAVATERVPVNDDITLPPTSVLLVEDTDYNAIAATAVLARLGLTCDRARNGAEALQMFAAKRHSIVLLDRNLPDMDGMEVAQRMREIETDGLHSVLLAVTAYCTAEDRALCLRAGMDAFVGKPLTPEKLRRVFVEAGRKMLASSSVEAPSASRIPELNTTLLEYLAEGTSGGVREQAERFIATLSDAHQEFLTLLDSGDTKAIADAAHRVLGHARMVGAARLGEALVAFETTCRRGDLAGAKAGLPALAHEIEAVTGALRRRASVPRA